MTTHAAKLADALRALGPLGMLAVVLGVCWVAIALVTDTGPSVELALVVAMGTAIATWHKSLLTWRTLVVATLLVILFIPIRLYTLPGDLPFQLEPYRVAVAALVAMWLSALLIDPRVRLRQTGFDAPIALIVLAVLLSVVLNPGRVSGVSDIVAKELTFLASFFVMLYMLVSVVTDRSFVRAITRTLVIGGAIVGFATVWESRTGTNVFNDLAHVLPLRETRDAVDASDMRGDRAYGSAQHPIALGAAMALLIPLAIYHAGRVGTWSRRLPWIACALLMLMGTLATVSRTSVVMLIVVVVVYLALRPRATRRLLPLVVPALILMQLILPGKMGTLQKSFFPEEGLIAQQSTNPEWRGSGRVADLAPSLAEFSQNPLLGQGYGTRVTDGTERENARILDNQWLAILLDIGLVGLIGWLWLFSRATRRLYRAALENASDDASLCVALAAGLTAFPVGMLTFDAFSFIQVTFFAFILLALAAVMLRLRSEDAEMQPRDTLADRSSAWRVDSA